MELNKDLDGNTQSRISETYDLNYFQRYLSKGDFTRQLRGEKPYLYRYWHSFLKRSLKPGSRVVEVGCGLGFLGTRIKRSFLYVGIDVAVAALEYARKADEIVGLIAASALSLPVTNESCQAVLAFDVVEHLTNPGLFFDEAYRVLAPGGILVFTTPNARSFGVRLKSRSGRLTPAMYTDKTHVSLLAPEVWSDMVQKTGFSIMRKGTDTLWDLPYFVSVPTILQKVLIIPINMLSTVLFGFFNWRHGENLVIIAKR